MAVPFQLQHASMLLRYSGISFISGAVNHGFFSGQRSLVTAVVGMVFFIAGVLLERRTAEDSGAQGSRHFLKALLCGAVLSIGLGFFTGGLQHFPDSPARSAWVVPLGFLLSVLALAYVEPRAWRVSALAYVVAGSLLVSAGSWGAWQWLLRHPDAVGGGHDHGHSDAAAQNQVATVGTPAAQSELVAQVVQRSIAIDMVSPMRFSPSTIAVKAGETVRFVIRNKDNIAHEMVLGSESALREHAQAMQAQASHAHEHAAQHGTAAIAVAAGQTGELVVRFAQAQVLQMACLIPGHFEAGMRGTLRVGNAQESSASAAPEAPAKQGYSAPPAHDHSAHGH
jgi:uncharacterized cupredoxin-like copper-binding protein